MCVLQRGPLHERAFVFCSAGRCIRGRVRCAALPLAFARPPAVLRCRSSAVPRASRRGQTTARFLVWVHRSRTTVVLEGKLESASGRRLAPYLRAQRVRWGAATKRSEERGAERMRGWAPAKQKRPPKTRTTQKRQWSTVSPLSERSERWGAENASFTRESPTKFPNQSNNFTTADAFSGGRAKRGWTLAKHRPSQTQTSSFFLPHNLIQSPRAVNPFAKLPCFVSYSSPSAVAQNRAHKESPNFSDRM